ncbi:MULTISPECIES: hypothetical protein [Streptomyces]|uniref:hypothetical protein n=1 Tax=Streptomyces TaxID=1883 RepID=UPI001E53B62D|nr:MULTISPECIES: hypothetical protein [Streptomyces]UFQ15464.1 hypothetical protein J2N69_10930 [Streptomyces huasconensis]WCL85068.1 hypothetical protein PPN52_10940 [Streptomyces sp. JCM 35825]
MRNARLLSGTALAVAAAGALAAPATAVPATAAPTSAPDVSVVPNVSAVPVGGLKIQPATVTPGSAVTVRTTACGTGGTAAGDASAVGAGTFTLAPGKRPEDVVGRFEVPPSAQPGTYEIVAKCSGAGGAAVKNKQVAGDLVVTITSTAAAAEQPRPHPRGHVKTGVGGALGPDPVQTAAGVAALAVAAAGGTWLLHRRARGDRI